jgi:hypothetical protein
MATLNINLDNVQPTLVSGTNIKTINGTTILGSGDLVVGGGSGVDTVTGDGVGGTSTDVVLTFPTPTEIGLGNVDNTSDSNKPVSTAQQTALDLKVDENVAIVGATKTKVTYDAKGLVTAGADATTADIADSTDKRYITDAQQTVLGNTSGTNTGDQDLSGYVQDSDFTSHSVLAKQSGAGSPVAVTIGTNEILGRLSGGGANIEGLSTSQVKTLLDLAGTNTGDQDISGIATNATNISTHIGDVANPHSVTATQVGLGNVSNTSDADKPVSSATQTALDLKVDENVAITGATKTKITYDAKGLVTSGADATTSDIADSTDKRYVTDAQQVVIGNTSGTNSGDNATNSQYSGLAGAIDALKTATITYIVDGGGTALTTGIKGDLEIPFACTINQVTLLADQSGSIVVDIWKDTYANYPPTVADTITAAAKPTISAALKGQVTTLTGWTTAITAGDTLRFNIDSTSTVTRVLISIKVTRT